MKKFLLKRIKKVNMNDEDGFTMIDLILAIFIFMLFGVYIVSLVVNSYVKSIDIQAGSYASAYATQVAQAIDDVSLLEIQSHQDDIINYLKTRGELPIDFLEGSDYSVSVNVEDVSDAVSDELKKVAIVINYPVNGEQKQLKIDKLKINDESRYWLRISMGSSEKSVGTIVNQRTGKPIGELTKSITGINPETGEVTINIDLVYFPDEDPPKAKPTDIVLVIDNSPSMLYSAHKYERTGYYNDNLSDIKKYYTRKAILLNAAKEFVDTISNWQAQNSDSMGEIYFSIVQFHGRNRGNRSYEFSNAATTLLDLTTDTNKVKTTLTKVNAEDPGNAGIDYSKTGRYRYTSTMGYDPNSLNGKFPDTISGTNIQEGMQEGVRALKLNDTSFSDHNKIMLLMTDGVPTEDTCYPATGEGNSQSNAGATINDATYKKIMNNTWLELTGLEDKKIQLVSMMIGLSGVEYDYNYDYSRQISNSNSAMDRTIVEDIFGTHEHPQYGRFYDVATVDLDRVIREEVVADIQAIILSFNNTVVVDNFPDDIANNFELTVHGDSNYTTEGDGGVSKMTWTPSDLTAGASTSISYTLKLKDMSDKDLMNSNGELATNGEVTLTSVTSSGDPVTADFDNESGSSPTILIEKVDK